MIPPDLQLSSFTDDHSVRREFKANSRSDETDTIKSLEACMITIKNWMDAVQLKINPSKKEFILFSYKVQLKKCHTTQIDVNGDLIVRSLLICYLGAWLDSNLNFKTHITKKCQAAMANFQQIKSILHLLDSTMCVNLCLSLYLSHLDYANSILYGLPDSTINKLQHVQNACAKLALRKGRYDSPNQCMRELHWLPIHQCIAFKFLVFTCKCLHDEALEYLKDLLVILTPSRPGLRSGSTSTICLLTP